MVILSRLFGSELRVKMMRLFIFNPDKAFDVKYIEVKTGSRRREIEKEAAFLKKTGLVRTSRKKKVLIVSLDPKFKYLAPLSDFLVKTHSLENRSVVKRIEKAGKIKAVVVSGIFTGQPDSRLDLFVVGDNVRSSSMDRIVKGIESDMGKDIRYAVLSAPDYAYRVSMNDKLIRDIVDYPHTVLLDKIGIVHS
ncbi:hypothetical protein KW799_00130 [Candidatus Parcubacteria bacterium]|nr:hypothetical protein [Candidatus Parcubacteria bacterium]